MAILNVTTIGTVDLSYEVEWEQKMAALVTVRVETWNQRWSMRR